jgi:hypothetical protein
MEFLDEIINMRIAPSAKENKQSVSAYCRVKLVGE